MDAAWAALCQWNVFCTLCLIAMALFLIVLVYIYSLTLSCKGALELFAIFNSNFIATLLVGDPLQYIIAIYMLYTNTISLICLHLQFFCNS